MAATWADVRDDNLAEWVELRVLKSRPKRTAKGVDAVEKHLATGLVLKGTVAQPEVDISTREFLVQWRPPIDEFDVYPRKADAQFWHTVPGDDDEYNDEYDEDYTHGGNEFPLTAHGVKLCRDFFTRRTSTGESGSSERLEKDADYHEAKRRLRNYTQDRTLRQIVHVPSHTERRRFARVRALTARASAGKTLTLGDATLDWDNSEPLAAAPAPSIWCGSLGEPTACDRSWPFGVLGPVSHLVSDSNPGGNMSYVIISAPLLVETANNYVVALLELEDAHSFRFVCNARFAYGEINSLMLRGDRLVVSTSRDEKKVFIFDVAAAVTEAARFERDDKQPADKLEGGNPDNNVCTLMTSKVARSTSLYNLGPQCLFTAGRMLEPWDDDDACLIGTGALIRTSLHAALIDDDILITCGHSVVSIWDATDCFGTHGLGTETSKLGLRTGTAHARSLGHSQARSRWLLKFRFPSPLAIGAARQFGRHLHNDVEPKRVISCQMALCSNNRLLFVGDQTNYVYSVDYRTGGVGPIIDTPLTHVSGIAVVGSDLLALESVHPRGCLMDLSTQHVVKRFDLSSAPLLVSPSANAFILLLTSPPNKNSRQAFLSLLVREQILESPLVLEHDLDASITFDEPAIETAVSLSWSGALVLGTQSGGYNAVVSDTAGAKSARKR